MSKEFLYRMFWEYRQIFLYVFLGILGLLLMAVVQGTFRTPSTSQPATTPEIEYRK
jgi:cytoskeletal protein RodZ